MTDTSDSPGQPLSGDVLPSSDTSGIWLSPSAAAVYLGVSERTLWRHVNAGRYHKRTVSGRSEVFVPRSRGAVTDKSATESGLALTDTPGTMTLAVIEELRRQHEATETRLTRQADDIRALAERAARAEALAESLAVERASAMLERDELRETLEQERKAVADRERRPWWRKVWG